ncbi:MAG: hypothetical protein AAF542_21745 [Pseudomonadota bacterium]
MTTLEPSEFDEDINALHRATMSLAKDYGIRRFLLGVAGTLIIVAVATLAF